MALIVFLRGINVGGHRRFRPSTLAHQLKKYDAVNIGATGTLVIRRPVGAARLRSELLRRLPFEAKVMICTADELAAAAAQHPFAGHRPRPGIVCFVSVLAKTPRVLPALPAQIPAEGRWIVKIVAIHGRFVFGYYRREMKAIGCLGAMDKLFGAPAATRSWKTIGTILKLLGNAALR